MAQRPARILGMMGGGAAESPGGLVRDLEILQALADAAADGGLRVTELARVTGRQKSQVSRALKRLSAAGLVAQVTPGGGFVVGWRLYALAAHSIETALAVTARPLLRHLAGELDEPVHLCVLRGTQLLTLHSEYPRHGLRAAGWMGVAMPAHASGAGRALLAGLDEEGLLAMYPQETLPDTPPRSPVRTRTELWRELEAIRRRGAAVVPQEFDPSVASTSAAARDFRGSVVCALTVTAPATQPRENLEDTADRLVKAARLLGARLGAP